MINEAAFGKLAQDYQRRYPVVLVCVDADGRLRFGQPACGRKACRIDCAASRRRAVFEALRWGEPSVNCCPDNRALWAVPLMENGRVYGGLVAVGGALDTDHLHLEFTSAQIMAACAALRLLAEEHNLTNAALLELHRLDLRRETERARALQAVKANAYDGIRVVYLREEPALLAAVKRGERREARLILNRILVGIYHFGGSRLDLLKSVVLELVVMLCRAAVEAGADPAEVLGPNYRSLAALALIEDEQALCHWLTGMLERQMDAIHDHRKYPNTALLGKALRYMREHIGEDLSRDKVARNAGLSPSHFSHLIKEKLGHSFIALLRQYRIDHARELLTRTAKSLAEVAAEAGFSDQSYFTKVFFKHTGATPGDYRRGHAARVSEP